MRMAQGEKLIKKWECRDTSGCGKTLITLTNRRVATERSLKVGGNEDAAGQEVILNSVKGVACTNIKKESEKGLNAWLIGAIAIGVVAIVIELVVGLTNLIVSGITPDEAMPEEITDLINTIFWIGLAIAVVLLIIGLITNKKDPDVVSYSVVLYTDATCTLNAVGKIFLGVKSANIGGESSVVIPITYEVAKDITDTIGAFLVLAKYGTPAEERIAEDAPAEEKAE